MEDSIFIEVLKFGAERGIEGISLEELEKFFQKYKKRGLTETELVLLKNIFDECFDAPKRGYSYVKFNLKTEYYFRLLEYQELQEARKASRQANNNAWIAIRISFFAIIFSLIVAGIQVFSPTKMDKADLNALIESNTNSAIQQEVKLDNLQMAQILSAIESSKSKPDIQKQKAILPSNEVQQHELINKYFEEE